MHSVHHNPYDAHHHMHQIPQITKHQTARVYDIIHNTWLTKGWANCRIPAVNISRRLKIKNMNFV
jgi:hypothetical protein